MVKAIWNGQVIAKSNKTVIVDRKHYFPKEDVDMSCLVESSKQTVCSWKGTANYFTLNVNGEKNNDAAWQYSNPEEKALNIKSYIAFSYIHGVDVIEED